MRTTRFRPSPPPCGGCPTCTHSTRPSIARCSASGRASYVACPAPLERSVVRGVQEMERLVTGRAARIAVLSEFVRNELAALRSGRRPGAPRSSPAGSTFASSPRAHGDAPTTGPRAQRTSSSPRAGSPRAWASSSSCKRCRRSSPSSRAPDWRSPAAAALQRRHRARDRANRGLQEHVRLLGRIPDDELVRWYRSATLVVMPTQELEGFGLTTAEAFACGTPVVGTPAGATPEILEPIDPRLVTRDTTPEALAEGIVAMLRDQKHSAERGRPDAGWLPRRWAGRPSPTAISSSTRSCRLAADRSPQARSAPARPDRRCVPASGAGPPRAGTRCAGAARRRRGSRSIAPSSACGSPARTTSAPGVACKPPRSVTTKGSPRIVASSATIPAGSSQTLGTTSTSRSSKKRSFASPPTKP